MNDHRNSFPSYSFSLSDFPPPFGITCSAIVRKHRSSPQGLISNLISLSRCQGKCATHCAKHLKNTRSLNLQKNTIES